jgi:hypothetical protein
MDAAQHWQKLFDQWPADVTRQGLIVTNFNEAIPFTDFLVSEGLIIVQRDRPDSLGARKAVVSMTAISAVKLLDPGELAVYSKMGFHRSSDRTSEQAFQPRPSLPSMPPRRPAPTH